MFKGRQKKSVEYLAIKRIEKSQMDVVVNEVQLMHALSSPHTLKFYDWYETRCVKAGATRARHTHTHTATPL